MRSEGKLDRRGSDERCPRKEEDEKEEKYEDL
jgi:hypothetical protein